MFGLAPFTTANFYKCCSCTLSYVFAEALVFLRQLGDFKIPAVMERRRKGLLDKLLELQGDTFRGDSAPKDSSKASPEPAPSETKLKSPEPQVKSPEPKVEKPAASKVEKEEDEKPAVRSTVTSPSRDSVTSPKRLSRGDSKISALVGNYEHITTLAKKEEQAETPKRFVQLKKVPKPSDFPDKEKGKDEEEAPKEEEKEELKPAALEKVAEKTSLTPEPSPQLRRKGKENGGLKSERPSSTVSEESANTEAPEEEEAAEDQDGGEKESSKKKGKFGRFGKKLGGKLKHKKQKGGRDKSPSRAMEEEDDKSGGSEVEEGEQKEEVATPEHEEGVKISGMLERKVTARFKSSKWVKVSVKLKDNVLYIGDKEKVELAGYMVAASDVGFDVVNHATQKQIQFRLEPEGENSKERWVEVLTAAIEECTPQQEGEILLLLYENI